MIRLFKYKDKKIYISCKYDVNIFKSIIKGRYSIPQCRVEEEDIVLDCGAHIGSFTFVSMKKAKIVYAFEPTPSSYKILNKNINLWRADNIIVIKKAVYCFNGENKLFFDYNRLDGSSLREFRKKQLDNPKAIDVECVTIDNFVKARKIQKIDFIKMDIEGSEMEALKGGKKTIKKFKPKMIIAAYHFCHDKKMIKKIVLSMRPDYICKFIDKSVNKSFGDLFFY